MIYARKVEETLASPTIAEARAEVLSPISLKNIASTNLNGKYKF